jgi:hypothetical protein
VADPIVYNAILESVNQSQRALQDESANFARASLANTPFNEANWKNIPLLINPTGCLCVYDATAAGQNRCGASCSWTVPGATTKAQFQMWGAGAGSGMGCCCGGSNFGATGAYATVIIDVTPGQVYTLCAGCANCCYVQRAQNSGYNNSSSWVQGPNLCNVCAMGGFAGLYRQMQILKFICTTCRYQVPGCQDAGACICNTGTDYCFSNSCASCGFIPYTVDRESTFYGCTTQAVNQVWGFPSVMSEACWDTNHFGYFRTPPIINVCHVPQPGSPCCFNWTSASCGGCLCQGCFNVMPWPGMGGFGTHMMGGCTVTISGDAGRAGMVRVTWC